MPCGPCAERRKMLDEAMKRDGVVRGVPRVAPKVAKHILEQIMKRKRDRWARNSPPTA